MQKKNKLGKKHKLIGVIYEEYLHSVLSWKIPVGILIILIVGIMVHYERQINNVMNGFEKLVSSSNFNKLLIFAAALPVSLSFADDWCSGRIPYVTIRSSRDSYIKGKIITCILGSWITTMLGLTVYIVYEMIADKGYIYAKYLWYYYGTTYFDAAAMNPFINTSIRIITVGAAFAVYVMGGLLISIIIPNRFVAIASPLLIYSVAETFRYLFPKYLVLDRLMVSNYLYVRNFKLDRLFGLMTITGYLIILGLLCYWCMDRRMKKEGI